MPFPSDATIQQTAQDCFLELAAGSSTTTSVKEIRAAVELKLELEVDALDTTHYRSLILQGIQDAQSPGEGSKKRKRKQPVQEYKSRSIIEDSDEEAPPVERPSPRRELAKSQNLNSEDSDSDEELPAKKKKTNDLKDEDEDALIKLPVKASSSKLSKPSKTTKPSMSKSKSAKSSKPKDKHEETLKRYKTLITACGVRRPYAKIFKEKGITDSLPKQVICLKRILQDELGMTGKMGMAQAKEIRERRELAQDIADADAFTKSILVNGKRASRSAPKTTRPSSDTEEQEIDAQPTARTSIAAFLQDQSDSESD